LKELIRNLELRRTPVGRDALSEYRLHIDTIDNKIIELLSERMGIARAIGEYKHAHNMAVVQQDRYNELLLAAEARAETMKLSPKFIHQIFSAIHEESVRQQLDKQK
jgi:chorismate mutase